MSMKCILATVLYFFLSSHSYGADEIYTKFFSSKAVGGYDVVSYFNDGGPQKGKSSISYTYKKAKWYFVSEANKALFVENPSNYAPQYGGYCAWAVAAKNSLVSASPLHWSIVEDKLYLNYDQSVKDTWLEATPKFIRDADKNWPSLIH